MDKKDPCFIVVAFALVEFCAQRNVTLPAVEPTWNVPSTCTTVFSFCLISITLPAIPDVSNRSALFTWESELAMKPMSIVVPVGFVKAILRSGVALVDVANKAPLML